jgi:hypothetical protein
MDEGDLAEEVYLYLSQRKYPDGCEANRKRQIRKKAEKFTLRDGELYVQYYNPGAGKEV